MKFVSNISKSIDPKQISQELTQNMSDNYDLGVLFVTIKTKKELQEILSQIKQKCSINNILTCTCSGIIGNTEEIEEFAGAALMVAKLPRAQIYPFYLDQEQLEGLKSKEKWYEFFDVYPNEKPIFIILPDPFNLNIDVLVKGLNEAFEKCTVVGGLASGAQKAGENVLGVNDQWYRSGAVGVVLKGDIKVDTVVSQGCRPIGRTYIVTKAEGNIIYEMGGRRFIECIEEVFKKTSPEEQRLAQQAIFVGIAMDEYKHELKRGDFIIRQVLGMDANTGGGVITDYVKSGQTIQIHLRDAHAATDDLNELLKEHHIATGKKKPKGALIFSCNGRGMHLFNEPNHDINIIQNLIGPMPAAGFFCAGEIGPVGGKTFLHGFTDSIVLFYSDKK